MTNPDEPVGTEQPVEDVLEQRHEAAATPSGPQPGLPDEADPGDVAEQRRPISDPEDPDEEERDYG